LFDIFPKRLITLDIVESERAHQSVLDKSPFKPASLEMLKNFLKTSLIFQPGNTKGGSIIVPLTSCLFDWFD
jgi:hypothetical protein